MTLDSSDGLMLGQHLLVSMDDMSDDSIDKSGIWLYSDYVLTDEDGKSYVWAADKKDRLENGKWKWDRPTIPQGTARSRAVCPRTI